MKILIYGINYKPELTGIGKYTGEMADWLASKNHDVCVVSAVPYYPDWRLAAGFRNWYSSIVDAGVKVFRCPLYVPAKPTTLKRLLHLISFVVASFPVLFRLLLWRPQVVFVVEPSFFCLPFAWLYARLCGARLVLHVQDYEIDAMFGLGMMNKGWLMRLAFAVESFFMARVDCVSTISQSMMSLAEKKGARKTLFFPNWVDTDFISPVSDREFFRRQWDISNSTKIILYSGNMGEKQGLGLVLDVADKLQEKNVLFLMVGEGAAKKQLQETAREKGLRNVRFEPLQPYASLPLLLACADIHLVIQKRGAADIVLPSKLTGILSAGGNSLITAEPETELGRLVRQYPGIAVLVEPESLGDFLLKLEAMLDGKQDSPNYIARSYAENFLSRESILLRFQASLSDLVKKGA